MSGTKDNFGYPCDICGNPVSFSFFHNRTLCSACLWKKEEEIPPADDLDRLFAEANKDREGD